MKQCFCIGPQPGHKLCPCAEQREPAPDDALAYMRRMQRRGAKVDDDGYEVVPDISAPKGVKCGRCGQKFEHGKAYGFVCSFSGCPLGLSGPSC